MGKNAARRGNRHQAEYTYGLEVRLLRLGVHDNTGTLDSGKFIGIGNVRHVTDTQHSSIRCLGNSGLSHRLLSIRALFKALEPSSRSLDLSFKEARGFILAIITV